MSNRWNLTIFQCLLYGIVGYIMGQYLDWTKMLLMYLMLFVIQFITRTKAVADGMVFRQIMIDNNIDANELAKRMKKEVDNIIREDKENWN